MVAFPSYQFLSSFLEHWIRSVEIILSIGTMTHRVSLGRLELCLSLSRYPLILPGVILHVSILLYSFYSPHNILSQRFCHSRHDLYAYNYTQPTTKKNIITRILSSFAYPSEHTHGCIFYCFLFQHQSYYLVINFIQFESLVFFNYTLSKRNLFF